MATIDIHDEDLARLQALAGIFEIRDVITKLLDQQTGTSNRPARVQPVASRNEAAVQMMAPRSKKAVYTFDSPPRLEHTKLLSARIGNLSIGSATWNGLRDQLIEMFVTKEGSIDALTHFANLKWIRGVKEDDGFHYLEMLGISVQGTSAKMSARQIGALSAALDRDVEVEFEWRNKPQAAQPGKRAVLAYTAEQTRK